jgi:hypothetical protein
MVLYNSLGFPGNGWGIVKNDLVRSREVREALGENVAPYSMRGNEFFRARFLAAVKANPSEFCRKIRHNFFATFKVGFYSVEIEPYLGAEDRQQYECLKEQLKALAGAQTNELDIEKFREQGVWDDDFRLASVPMQQWLFAATRLLPAGASAVYLVALLVAVGWIVLFDRAKLGEPIFLCATISVLCLWSLVCLIQYESRQLNILYPLGIPPLTAFVDWVTRAGARRRCAAGADEASREAIR